MKMLALSAAALLAALPAAALAQDDMGRTDMGEGPRVIEPYVGVMGGVHVFDSEEYRAGPGRNYHGYLVEGVAGVNFNLGRLVLGVEGQGAKGVDQDIDWEYGAAGRVGVRLGKDSMFFGKVGYTWVQFNVPGDDRRHYDEITYGGGVELSLADMGMAADTSNIRLRVQADTRGNFHSIRPMAGIVAKF